MKKGFTLIELLAVIVILAIIAVIAVPIVLNIINDTKESAVLRSADFYLEGLEQSLATSILKDIQILDGVYYIMNDGNVCIGTLKNNTCDGDILKVEMDGEVPTNGYVEIENGSISNIEMLLSEKTIIKNENGKLEFKQIKNIANIAVNELGVSVPSCVSDGSKCTVGTPIAIKVNITETYKFHVLKDDGKTITLIMSKELGEPVAWISQEDYNDDVNYGEKGNNNKGPVTAINYLDELTDNEWSYIPKKAYTYSGIGHKDGTRIYNDITKVMRARLITHEEATSEEVGCIWDSNYSCPSWLHNFNEHGHWTSTPNSTIPNCSIVILRIGRPTNNDVSINDLYTVRPVIELSK